MNLSSALKRRAEWIGQPTIRLHQDKSITNVLVTLPQHARMTRRRRAARTHNSCHSQQHGGRGLGSLDSAISSERGYGMYL